MQNVIHADEYVTIQYDECLDTTEFFDKETNRKLFKNLPPSKGLNDVCDLKMYVDDLSDANVSIAEEGTTLRVFNHRGRWYTATKRKLQAFRSSWADKTTTFGATFAKAVREEINFEDDTPDRLFLINFYHKYLDPKKVYFFLLRSTAGERIVCDPPVKPTALHICTQENFINDFKDRICYGPGKFFPHTTPIDATFEAIQEHLSTMDYRQHQGVIVEQNGEFYKVTLPLYAKFFAVRGEMPSLRMCYLKLRSPKFFYERNLFLENYPSFVAKIEPLETEIYAICCRLHKLYLEKFINKIQINLNQTDLKALKIIHHVYLVSRIPTTPQRINDTLTDHPVIVNHLLKDKQKFEKSQV